MNHIEAMKLALEALDDYLLGDENLPFKCAKAITAIREALAEPDYKALYEKAAQQYNELAALMAEQPAQQRPQNCGTGYCSCIECLFEQPAQQQEPISLDDISLVCLPHAYPGAAAFAKGWNSALATLSERGPLYTSPPASKPWVGLTRPERFEIEQAMSKYYDYRHECKTVCLPEFAAAIEAKLKEKNHG